MVIYGAPASSRPTDRKPLRHSSEDALALIRALGLAHFPKLLVRALRDLLSIDHLSIVRIDSRLPHDDQLSVRYTDRLSIERRSFST